MEKENIIFYLQGLAKKLVPMKIVLQHTILYLEGTALIALEHKKQISKTLQQVAEFIEKSREEYSTYKEPQYFEPEEYQAVIYSIVELLPNTIKADFTNRIPLKLG